MPTPAFPQPRQEIDPERLMAAVRMAIGARDLAEHGPTGILAALHGELVALGAGVELGVVSAALAESFGRRSEILFPLLRQGRLCFGMDGVCSMHDAELEVREHAASNLGPKGRRGSAVSVQWRWGEWVPQPGLPGRIRRALAQCAREELTHQEAQGLEEATQACTGQRGRDRL